MRPQASRPWTCARCLSRPSRKYSSAPPSRTSHKTSSSSNSTSSPRPESIHSYTTTPPPTQAQLRYAARFFTRIASPKALWSAATFRAIPPASPYPEVCFLGRSNAGKSSLLNALLGRPAAQPAHVSRRPGRTKLMNGFGVGGLELMLHRFEGQKSGGTIKIVPGQGRAGKADGQMVLVDMPGYGQGSREEWGQEVLKFLEQRRQLRRAFLLVDVTHGLKETDLVLLKYMADKGIGHQVVLSKADKLLFPTSKEPSVVQVGNRIAKVAEVLVDVQKQLAFGGRTSRALGDVLTCSAEKRSAAFGGSMDFIGINAVRWAMLSACGLGSDEHGNRKAAQELLIAEAPFEEVADISPGALQDSLSEYERTI